ncbi:carbohydrate ABC transporter permease [Nocardiopsis changdeensis]|uniref:Sugar ABC transporter permease n=1 Tax=Nocardiopsis changdeensis TaxID=2831969 RepID=A0ABX8BE01_9ACTN|nr:MULTISPECIES: sugar ABC transporter permease [Nocardiopsis]QUX20259.1 sugar ABC transporter permease [Nocardiopsis changdeensis]QYX36189.1 sugar ABC transporter permease [Nocardiopsis sp. MT53]
MSTSPNRSGAAVGGGPGRTSGGGPRPAPRRALHRARAWLPGLLLVSPSILLIGVFVYGMIGWNLRLALSDKHAPIQEGEFVGLVNFVALWQEARWPAAVGNAVVFTVVFVGGALVLGWLLGLLLDKGIRGEPVFRTLFLAPMAVSFIATGVVWRWLMNPAPAERATGLNALFVHFNLDFLVNDWWTAPDLGMAAMALPAIWQLAGYIMALFLAGFRGVPEELREAARVDGCSEWGVYRHVVMPQLRPVLLSAVIILGHMSLKVFDLIIAIAGQQIVADVPAVYMWAMVFEVRDPAKGATIASYLLFAVALFVVPYLVWTVRKERSEGR